MPRGATAVALVKQAPSERKARSRQFAFVLNDEDHAALLEVAAKDGRSAASWLRVVIRSAAARGSANAIAAGVGE